MDTRTGKIYDRSMYSDQEWEDLKKKLGDDLQEIPKHLESEANNVINNDRSNKVSLTNGSGLAKFAAKKRRTKKRLQRKSRQKNRS